MEFYEEGGKQALLKDDFKYIKLKLRGENNAKISAELYKLKEDIAEQNNVMDLYPDLVKELELILQKEHQEFEFIDLFSVGGNKH